MKKRVRIGFLIIMVLIFMVQAFPDKAEAVNFFQTYMDENGSGGFDADGLSARQDNNKVYVSATTIFYYTPVGITAEIAKRQKASLSVKGWQNLAYKSMQEQFIYVPKQYCIYAVSYFDNNGQLLEQVDLKSSFKPIGDGSFQDSLHQAIFVFLGY